MVRIARMSPARDNGATFTGRGGRPAFGSKGASWRRSGAVFGYTARRDSQRPAPESITPMPPDTMKSHTIRVIATAQLSGASTLGGTNRSNTLRKTLGSTTALAVTMAAKIKGIDPVAKRI